MKGADLRGSAADSRPDPGIADTRPDPRLTDARPDPRLTDARPDPRLTDARPDPGLAETRPELRARIESRLALLRLHPDGESHIAILSQDTCRACPEKWCNYFCPAAVYEFDTARVENRVAYEQCIECGTCRIGCPYRNIEWRPPRGGFGVQHRYG